MTITEPEIRPARPLPVLLPAEPTVRIAQLLSRQRLDGLLPAVLTVLEPHVADRPTGLLPGAACARLDLLTALRGLLADAGSAIDVLVAVAPWLQPDGGRSRRQLLPPVVEDELPPLSERELEVLARAARGMKNAQIARDLHLAEDTVKTHLRRLSQKLGAVDRTNAVAIGYETGVLGQRPDA